MRRALVLGGSGAVGSAVVRALRARGVPTAFTFLRSADRARALADESGARALSCDLADRPALRALLRDIEEADAAPDVLIACAAALRVAPLAELTDEDWDEAIAVGCRAPFVAAQALAPAFARAGGGDVVLVGAIDRSQSLPLPAAFAAAQGALASLTMALAKELGPTNTRVNLLALGPLTTGLAQRLPPEQLEAFVKFSALRRLGTAEEAARVTAWLALDNGYLSGKVVAVNGGI